VYDSECCGRLSYSEVSSLLLCLCQKRPPPTAMAHGHHFVFGITSFCLSFCLAILDKYVAVAKNVQLTYIDASDKCFRMPNVN